MYKEYFNLKKMPFENVWDMDFFFDSPIHKEAVARMTYLIESKKPCGVLIGGYGTGKTFLLKHIEKNLSNKGYVFSFINNPRIDDLGLLRMILHSLTGYDVPKNKEDVLMGLEKFFKNAYKDAKHVVIIIDEAQEIENEKVFEELRLLLNYQNEERSLLTLILSGQEELLERISSNRQFSQRIFLNSSLSPLTLEETKEYIYHRILISGGKKEIFPENICSLIYERTLGIPRRINNICNVTLLEAFSQDKKVIDESILNEAIKSVKE